MSRDKWVITPPRVATFPTNRNTLFLAGSIEMGSAEPWQDQVIGLLGDQEETPFFYVFNPRRPDWDSSWEQTILHSHFRNQVLWEQRYLDWCETILFHFDPNTKSPIALFELGMALGKNKQIVVSCPDGFWRKGNIEVVCASKSIPVYGNVHEAVSALRARKRNEP
jgi:hypothetical protein